MLGQVRIEAIKKINCSFFLNVGAMYQENREVFPSNWLYYKTCEILLIL